MKPPTTILTWAALGLLCLLMLVLFAGQLGAFRGEVPTDLGVKDVRLKPPSLTPNSVSSQADLYQDHLQRIYAQIPPLRYGDKADMASLAVAVQTLGNCTIVKQDSAYLYAQCKTAWLGFVDDLEVWNNVRYQRYEVRSASRLGRKDMGVNRARVEKLRNLLKP